MKSKFFQLLLLLLFAGLSSSITAAPLVLDDERAQQTAIFADHPTQHFGALIAPAVLMANLSDDVQLSPTADSPRFWDGEKFFTTNYRDAAAPGSCMRTTNSNDFTAKKNNNVNCDKASGFTMGVPTATWACVICDNQATVANSAASFKHATSTTAVCFSYIGQTSCHLFSNLTTNPDGKTMTSG